MKLDFWKLVVVVVIGLAAVGLWFALSDVDNTPQTGERETVRYSRKGIREANGRLKPARKNVFRGKDKESLRVDVRNVSERPKLDDLDEKELSELEKKVLAQLRAALDNDNLKVLRRALVLFHQKRQQGGLEGKVPKVLRQAAVSALGWFGGAAASDLVEFMADVDPEIEEDAFAKFELALDDWEIGDYERAEILKTALKAITDTERIDSLMFSLNNMRNSVKADTILDILASGSDASKAVMREQYEFYTDSVIVDDGVVVDDKLIEQNVNKWKTENPDDPSDDDFYGPQK